MPNIRFRGAITDTVGLQGAFDACDCIVCPSYAEGMPTVVLEAMARGLAVIATDVGATREIVDSANGVLLPGPGVDSLAAAMAALIHASPKELDRMKRASLERSSGYTWEEVTARLIEQIRVAIQGSR